MAKFSRRQAPGKPSDHIADNDTYDPYLFQIDQYAPECLLNFGYSSAIIFNLARDEADQNFYIRPATVIHACELSMAQPYRPSNRFLLKRTFSTLTTPSL